MRESEDPGKEIERQAVALVASVMPEHLGSSLQWRVRTAVVRATAQFDFATDLVAVDSDLEAIEKALRSGVPVVCDTRMTLAAVSGYPNAHCLLPDRAPSRLTRSAAGIDEAIERFGAAAGYVVGTSPSALAHLLSSEIRPAFVIGVPVGFVGAVETKRALRDAPFPKVTNRSERGGAAVAGAVLHALWEGERNTETTEHSLGS